MRDNWVETLVGAFVIVLAAGFIVYGYSITEQNLGNHYNITAKFDSAGGVIIGSDVRMAGIKVGTVSKLQLDSISYNAIVEMTLQDGIMLPDDSSAKITSDGLLGNNYIALTAGASEDFLLEGDRIIFTQGSVDIIGLVGQALFNADGRQGATE